MINEPCRSDVDALKELESLGHPPPPVLRDPRLESLTRRVEALEAAVKAIANDIIDKAWIRLESLTMDEAKAILAKINALGAKEEEE